MQEQDLKIDAPRISRAVSEQGFRLTVADRTVPGVLWKPEAGEPSALVLLGHGGSMDKRAPYLLAVARRLARHFNVASAAIDGPGHGERQPKGDFDSAWNDPNASDDIVADWRGALDACLEQTGKVPVGYFGLSMGTMMGLPLVVAEPRISAAVLGLMGLWGPNGKRLATDAPSVTAPLRFLVQWHDEIVPRDRCLDLFDALGSKEKHLHANPGAHAEVPPAEMRDVADYLARQLT